MSGVIDEDSVFSVKRKVKYISPVGLLTPVSSQTLSLPFQRLFTLLRVCLPECRLTQVTHLSVHLKGSRR
jgi:hypothetical protein